jgi:hypothetical protein
MADSVDERRISSRPSDVLSDDESGGDDDDVTDEAAHGEKEARRSVTQDDDGGEHQDPHTAEQFRGLVFVLASCRPDVMSPKDRKALVDEAVANLKDDIRMRRELVEWKGASRYIAPCVG